jgi:hypothetical protein
LARFHVGPSFQESGETAWQTPIPGRTGNGTKDPRLDSLDMQLKDFRKAEAIRTKAA